MELLQMLPFLAFVVLILWISLPAAFAALFGKSGLRKISFVSVILFLAAGSILPLCLAGRPFSYMRSIEDSVLDLVLAPAFYTDVLFIRGLGAALLLALICLALTLFAARRLAAKTAYIVAVCLGLCMPLVALTGQYLLTTAQITNGAVSLGFDCVKTRPVFDVLQEVGTPSFSGPYFTSFHALGRKGDDVWIWSYRASAWVKFDPDTNDPGADPRADITC